MMGCGDRGGDFSMVSTPGNHGPSLVNTLGGQDSPVMNTPASRNSTVFSALGILFVREFWSTPRW
jgi:hypothetical protein